MQGIKTYQEKLFVSFQLSERVAKENFYRRLKETLDLNFLYALTRKYYGQEGQKGIDPVVFLKLMLIGYMENICSDRKIIEQASMRLDMLYFLGYDIDETLPWHSTLSRTRQLYGEELFLEVFRKVLGLCVSKGMVKGSRQAVDSAYIKSNASMESLVEKTLLEDTGNYFKELTDNEEKSETKRPKPRKRNTRISNADFTSITDPDARVSKKKHTPLQLNYSGQISVDTASHVICGAMADFADKKDSQSLPDIVEQVYENLRAEDIKVEEVLADTNYSSGEALRYLEEKDITGYIPNFGLYKNEHEGFTYFPHEDCYLCSQGVKLPFKGMRKRSDSEKKVKQYWSLTADCINCPLKADCTNKRGVKVIEDTTDKPYYERMYRRVHGKEGRRMKKQRSATVEPVLGTLLQFRGMRKVYTKGINAAHKHVLLACTAYNLKKLMRFRTISSIAQVMQIQVAALQSAFLSVTSLFYWLTVTFYTSYNKKTMNLMSMNDFKLLVRYS
jgi:transposase